MALELYRRKEQEKEVDVITKDTCRMHTGNGHGSTNTFIRRMTNIAFNISGYVFGAIAASQDSPNGLFRVTDSATSATEVTILKGGIYTLNACDSHGAGTGYNIGFSFDSSQLTTSIDVITIADRLKSSTVGSIIGDPNGVSWSGYLSPGVVRFHTDGNPDGTADTIFTITGEIVTKTKISDL